MMMSSNGDLTTTSFEDEDMDDIEVVPLTSRIFQRSASALTSTPSCTELQQQPLEQRRATVGRTPRGATVPLPVSEAAAAVLIFVTGRFFPRYLIAHETVLGTKVPPSQVTAAGDVLLDFSLNHPLIEPPTIPCTYHLTYLFVELRKKFSGETNNIRSTLTSIVFGSPSASHPSNLSHIMSTHTRFFVFIWITITTMDQTKPKN